MGQHTHIKWYQSKHGMALQKRVLSVLPQVMSNVAGQRFLQISVDGWPPCIEGLSDIEKPDVLDKDGKDMALKSYDCVILLHALEVVGCARSALDRASQLLSESGTLIIVGFNPHSLMGLQQFVRKSGRKTTLKMVRPELLLSWLFYFSYDVAQVALSRDQVRQVSKLKLRKQINILSQMLTFDSTYLFVGKKTTYPMSGITKKSIKHGGEDFAYAKICP